MCYPAQRCLLSSLSLLTPSCYQYSLILQTVSIIPYYLHVHVVFLVFVLPPFVRRLAALASLLLVRGTLEGRFVQGKHVTHEVMEEGDLAHWIRVDIPFSPNS